MLFPWCEIVAFVNQSVTLISMAFVFPFCFPFVKLPLTFFRLKERNDVRQHGVNNGIQNVLGNTGVAFIFGLFILSVRAQFRLIQFCYFIHLTTSLLGFQGRDCPWQVELWYHNSMLGKTIPSFFYTRERKTKEDLTDFETCSNILLSN